MGRFCFFDLDGTLADTDPDIRRAWKAALADLGLECPRFDELFVSGPPIDEMTRILFPGAFTQELADAVRRGFAAHYDGDGYPGTREYPGVLDEVRRLAAEGFTVAIVTNKRHVAATAMARHFGWDALFDGVYAGDMFADPRAAARLGVAPGGKVRKPELLRRVMAAYGAAPGDCAMVGDTSSDFEAARENGVFSVGVAWGYGTPEELSQADVVCREPGGLAESLSRREGVARGRAEHSAGDSPGAYIEVRGLRVRYGGFEAVRGVSFTLGPGEMLGIVGESGSGKSTIAKTLMGLHPKSGGEVVVRARSVQMIFQDAVGSLNPRMTVGQALREVLRVRGVSSRTPEGLLDLVGLSRAVLDQYPREMSGGQCQRVSIARALACEPQVLVADEPVSALDVSVQARVLNLLRDLRRSLGLSILLIAHDLAVVKNVCDRICVMEKGVFVDEGDPEAVFSSPRSEYTRRLLAAVPRVP